MNALFKPSARVKMSTIGQFEIPGEIRNRHAEGAYLAAMPDVAQARVAGRFLTFDGDFVRKASSSGQPRVGRAGA